jgi:hypothetical protein
MTVDLASPNNTLGRRNHMSTADEERQARRAAQAVGLKAIRSRRPRSPTNVGEYRIIERMTGDCVAGLYYELTAADVIAFCAKVRETNRGLVIAAERVRTLTSWQRERVEHEIAAACLRLEAKGILFRRLVDGEVRWVHERCRPRAELEVDNTCIEHLRAALN